MSSLERILPFVKPIEHLLLDPSVTEVMVNDGGRRVFVERDGALEECPRIVARRAQPEGRDQEHRARRAATRSRRRSPSSTPGSRTARAWPRCSRRVR